MDAAYEITYTAADGTRQTLGYTKGRALVPRREAFAMAVAYGADKLDAYCQAYGKTVANDLERRHYTQTAAHLADDTDVKLRILELRRPIQKKLAKKWEYTLDHALQDCQEAYDIAYADGDSKAMQSCIRLRAELTRLLNHDAVVTHKYGVLDEETTEVLLALRDSVKRRHGHPNVIDAEPVKQITNRDAGPPMPPIEAGPAGPIARQ